MEYRANDWWERPDPEHVRESALLATRIFWILTGGLLCAFALHFGPRLMAPLLPTAWPSTDKVTVLTVDINAGTTTVSCDTTNPLFEHEVKLDEARHIPFVCISGPVTATAGAIKTCPDESGCKP